MAWLLGCLVIVALTGSVTGLLGWFGPVGFLIGHGCLLVGLLGARRGRWRADAAAWVAWAAKGAQLLRGGPWRWAVRGLVLVIAGHVVVAAFAPLLIYDALTYRLPRIAHWLQDGRVAHLWTDDQRLNFMPVASDLVVAWLIGGAGRGYVLAALAQTLGGILLLGATWSFARRSALSVGASLGAIALVLGMPNVAPQFSSLHTDLFTAGVLAAAAALWVAALERGRGSWLAGAGLGVAIAAKGTVLYAAPALAIWAAWSWWRHRPHARALQATLGGGVLAMALLLGPLWWRNHAAYGRISAPLESVQGHYGSALSCAQRVEKLQINLKTSLAQLLDPHSQPLWLRDAAERAGVALVASLSESDQYVFEGLRRAETLQMYFAGPGPDADFAGPGLLVVLLALVGFWFAVGVRRRAGAGAVTVWGLGIASYVVTQNALFQWHPWGLRYALLIVPWLAIVVAWTVQQVPRLGRVALWAVLLTSAAWSAGEAVVRRREAFAAAWQGNADGLLGGWRFWATTLEPKTSGLRLALPGNSGAAGFFRDGTGRSVRLVSLAAIQSRSLEELVAEEPDAWLVVPAKTFLGREGRVEARVWIVSGEIDHPQSLAAYRRLRPGRPAAPVIYADAAARQADGLARRLLIRAWEPSTDIVLDNPSAVPWSYDVAGSARGTLPPGGRVIVRLGTDPERLTIFEVRFGPMLRGGSDHRVPVVREVRRVQD
jgi:hypothetical protein